MPRLLFYALLLICFFPRPALSASATRSCQDRLISNPLLRHSNLRFGAPRYDLYRPEHILPALDVALEKHKDQIRKIRENPEEPTFKNTILALEFDRSGLDPIIIYRYILESTDSTEEVQKICKKVDKKVSRLTTDLTFDKKLFRRIQSVYEKRDELRLTHQERRLLEETHRSFVDSGINLPAPKRKRLAAIGERLSLLTQEFSDHLKRDWAEFSYEITDSEKLQGLPSPIIDRAKANAIRRNKPDSYIFLKTDPTAGALLSHLEDREIRREVHFLNLTTGQKNHEIIKELVKLRHEVALIHGFKDFAHMRISHLMAETPERVNSLLDELLRLATPGAQKEFQEFQEFVRSKGGPDPIERWDLSFWMEQMERDTLNLNSEKIKEYFPIKKALSGLFYHLKRTYNVTFKESFDLPRIHPEVRVFEVYDLTQDKPLGLIYFDPYQRPRKDGGAHQMVMRSHSRRNGRTEMPLIQVLTNFEQPHNGRPSLLEFENVKTLFHEFGHAIETLFSQVDFPSIGRMVRDAIELPSQFMEDFPLREELLAHVSGHFETGEPLPQEFVEALRRAQTFQAGWNMMSRAGTSKLDLAWHSEAGSQVTEVEAFEKEVMAPYRLLPPTPGQVYSAGLTHIFSGGYSAALYSYLWADVLAADVFDAFSEPGLYNPKYREIAKRFRQELLARGNSRPTLESFRIFRGREPKLEYMLRRAGLLPMQP